MDAQLRELLTEYGPVAVIWFDGLDHQEKYKGAQVLDLIHHIQPATLVNNRIGVSASSRGTRSIRPRPSALRRNLFFAAWG